MPKETFFRIKSERRERILNAAIHEFSEHGYSDASVNRILSEANIAAGSFYQYFEDLKDLFYHITFVMVTEKNRYMQDAVKELVNPDLETFIRALYKGGIKFSVENERYVKIGNHFMRMQHSEIYHELVKIMPKSDIFNWLGEMVAKAIERKEIKEGVTPTLFMMLFMNVNTTIVEYMMLSSQKSFDFAGIDLDVLTELAVDLLLSGVKNKEGNL